MTRPIVFLTDYGSADEFVGVCHGVISRIAPDAHVIDLTHHVARQDVLQGAIVLSRAVAYMPADAVFLAVVDPGVGSERLPIAVQTRAGAHLVGPDNGLLSMAWAELSGATAAVAISAPDVLLHPVSRTFHGRDIFAPAAAHLASGAALEDLGPPVDVDGLHVLELPRPMVTPGTVGARVMGVDGFGNVQLNATPADLEAAGVEDSVSVGARRIPRVAAFSDVPPGVVAAIVDSAGHVALVVNRGSAAQALGLSTGDSVVLGA
jgi:S-adenosyl-L-methionine hydrolase (adenosine-forming)